jgi:hypothetical protein
LTPDLEKTIAASNVSDFLYFLVASFVEHVAFVIALLVSIYVLGENSLCLFNHASEKGKSEGCGSTGEERDRHRGGQDRDDNDKSKNKWKGFLFGFWGFGFGGLVRSSMRRFYFSVAFPEVGKIVAFLLVTWDVDPILMLVIGTLTTSVQRYSLKNSAGNRIAWSTVDMSIALATGARLGARAMFFPTQRIWQLGLVL